jgi:hypothetical protein
MAAYSCDPMMAALHLWLGTGGSLGMAGAAFVECWILNFVISAFLVHMFLFVFGCFHLKYRQNHNIQPYLASS